MAKNWGEPICKIYVDIGWPLLESVGVWWCLMLRQIAKFCERTVFCPVLLHISFCSNFHLWSRLALWWGETVGLGWMTKKWPSYLILTQLPGHGHGGTLNSSQLNSSQLNSSQVNPMKAEVTALPQLSSISSFQNRQNTSTWEEQGVSQLFQMDNFPSFVP